MIFSINIVKIVEISLPYRPIYRVNSVLGITKPDTILLIYIRFRRCLKPWSKGLIFQKLTLQVTSLIRWTPKLISNNLKRDFKFALCRKEKEKARNSPKWVGQTISTQATRWDLPLQIYVIPLHDIYMGNTLLDAFILIRSLNNTLLYALPPN